MSADEGDAPTTAGPDREADEPADLAHLAEFGLDHEPEPGVTLRAILQEVGVPGGEIDHAEEEGTLELLAIERLVLPEPARFDLDQVALAAGMPKEQVEHLWRALGFPDPRPGDALFTDTDVEMMETVVGLLELGVTDPDLLVQMARVIGSSLARVANAQIDAFQVTSPEDRSQVDESFAVQAGVLLPTMPKIMDYVWRRHLKAAAERRMVRLADSDRADDRLVVGFADLVGFTALSQQVDAHELAAVVDRFETVAYETVAARGGRVVKMIGDEVMFTVDHAEPALEIALDLAAAYHDDESLSDVRVGLAVGPVLQREADCYGPVVNRASRIVGIAFPGTVVTDDDVHQELVGDGEDPAPGFRWRSLHTRNLKDIGKVRLWSVKREGDPTPEPSRRDKARARRAERHD